MAWKLHAIEQTQLQRQHRVDGAGRPKFDFHTDGTMLMFGFVCAARMTRRPIRPNPLIPTRIDIFVPARGDGVKWWPRWFRWSGGRLGRS